MIEQAMRNKFAPHIDFGGLKGLIANNPKALPSNLDMVLERRGYFLVGEWKRAEETVSRGQEILLCNLALNAAFTVIQVTGYNEGDKTIVTEFSRIEPSGKRIIIGNSFLELKGFILAWYLLVEMRRKR